MTLSQIVEAWPIIASLGALLVAWGGGRYLLRTLGDDLKVLAGKMDVVNATLGTMTTTLAVHAAQLLAHERQDALRFDQVDRQLTRLVGEQ